MAGCESKMMRSSIEPGPVKPFRSALSLMKSNVHAKQMNERLETCTLLIDVRHWSSLRRSTAGFEFMADTNAGDARTSYY